MRKIILGLTIVLSISNLSFGQATFDPEANKKRAEERQAQEKAEKEQLMSKLNANKERLLAKLPKTSYEKLINNEYRNDISFYNENNNPSNNREVQINKTALQNFDEKTQNFINDYSNYYITTFKSEIDTEQIELAKKHYTGAIILKNINDSIPLSYVKYSDISESDRFVYVAYKNIKPDYFLNVYDFHYSREVNLFKDENPEYIKTNTGQIPHYWNDEKYYVYRVQKKVILKNIKTELYYVVNENSLIEEIFIKVPPTAEELAKEKEKLNQLVAKYKSLIKKAKAKTVVLGTIQRKYLTRGYFDPNKVSAVDKKTYNSALSELKVLAKQLKDIDDEDKNDKAQDELTIEELATLNDVNIWKTNFNQIN